MEAKMIAGKEKSTDDGCLQKRKHPEQCVRGMTSKALTHDQDMISQHGFTVQGSSLTVEMKIRPIEPIEHSVPNTACCCSVEPRSLLSLDLNVLNTTQMNCSSIQTCRGMHSAVFTTKYWGQIKNRNCPFCLSIRTWFYSCRQYFQQNVILLFSPSLSQHSSLCPN